MANALYDNFRDLMIGDAGASHTLPVFDTGTFKAQLQDAGAYTYAITDEDEADLAAEIAVFTLTNVTAGAVGVGVVDADDIVFSSVSGVESEMIVLYEETAGAASTDPLIAMWDTATGLPVTPTGGDITAIVNASGLFTV